MSNNFLLANFGLSIKSYFYKAFKIYHLYNDKYSYYYRDFIILKENNGKLIASNEDGNIRVWSFHSGQLLDRVKISHNFLKGLCLWNNDCLLVSCGDGTIKAIYLNNGFRVKSICEKN